MTEVFAAIGIPILGAGAMWVVKQYASVPGRLKDVETRQANADEKQDYLIARVDKIYDHLIK